MTSSIEKQIQNERKKVKFINAYPVEESKMRKIKKMIDSINAIYSESNETFEISKKGLEETQYNKKTKTRKRHRISNFFVIPVYRLFDKEEREVGLEVDVFFSIKWYKYKRVRIKLSNQMLNSSDWINPEKLDYEFNLVLANKYQVLKRAILLATRTLKLNKNKYYLPQYDFWLDMHDYEMYKLHKQLESRNQKNFNEDELRISLFVHGISILLEKYQLHKEKVDVEISDNYIGWDSEGKYYLDYSLAKDYIEMNSKEVGILNDVELSKDFFEQIYKLGILGANKERTKLRFDKKLKLENKSTRVLEIDKEQYQKTLKEVAEILHYIENLNKKTQTAE